LLSYHCTHLTRALPIVPTLALPPGVTTLFHHCSSPVTVTWLTGREAKVTTLTLVTLPPHVAVQTHALTSVEVTVGVQRSLRAACTWLKQQVDTGEAMLVAQTEHSK